MAEECKCNTCKYREVKHIICPCLDCHNYSEYQEEDNSAK